MTSVFADIMREAVQSVPGAVGGAFAASDGETVDAYHGAKTQFQWALITAHFGVIFSHIQSSMTKTFDHEANLVFFRHLQMDILIQSVAEGYYAIMALQGAGQIGAAIIALDTATTALRNEMF